MNKTSNFVSPQKILSKENALLVSIVSVLAILAIAVFAAANPQHGTGMTNVSVNGSTFIGGAGQNLSGTLAANAQYRNFTYNFTLLIGVINGSINVTSFTINASPQSGSTTGWNFTYVNVIGSGNSFGNNSSTQQCIMQNATGATVGDLGTGINCTSMGNWSYGHTVSFVIGMNFSEDKNFPYNFSINITNNLSAAGVVGNGTSNLTNFTVLADWRNPRSHAVYNNTTSVHHIVFMNQSVNITFMVNDTNLNFTQGGGVNKLNITFYNASDNSSSGPKNPLIYIQPANISVNRTLAGIGNFSFEITVQPNTSVKTNETWNLSANITMVDNATNTVTAYWSGWVMFDNQSPKVTAITQAGSGSDINNTAAFDPSANLVVDFNEMLDGNTANNTTVILYQTGTSSNTSVVITYSNTSNKGRVTINPDAALAFNTNYTLNISVNATAGGSCLGCQVRDMAGGSGVGNAMVSVHTINFKTQAQASTDGAGGGGAGTGAAAGTTGTVASVGPTESSATVSISAGGVVNIEIQVAAPSGDSKVEQHKMEVVSIVGTLVTLKFTSAPVFVDVNVGETKYVDINGDSINDVKVTVNGVSSGTADITVELLPSAKGEAAKQPYIPSTPSVEQPSTPTTEQPSVTTPEAAAAKPISTKLILVIVVVLVIVAGAYWFTQKDVMPSKRSV